MGPTGKLVEQATSAPRGGGAPGSLRRTLRAGLWWLATLATLVVIDDLAFGPVFWAISRLRGSVTGFVAALVIYVPAQILIVWRATSGQPGRLASFFLDRLNLQRRSTEIRAREGRLRERVTGMLSSGLLSLIVGGVIPPLILWRSGFSTSFVRRLVPLTATIYATEFALIHGFVPDLL